MIISTTETIPSREISEILGIARGSTVRARNVARDIFAGIKNFSKAKISEAWEKYKEEGGALSNKEKS